MLLVVSMTYELVTVYHVYWIDCIADTTSNGSGEMHPKENV